MTSQVAAGKTVGILIDGESTFHAASHGHGDYNSLCGIDADDPSIGHGGPVPAARGQKITCQQCFAIWRGTLELKLRASNFDELAQR